MDRFRERRVVPKYCDREKTRRHVRRRQRVGSPSVCGAVAEPRRAERGAGLHSACGAVAEPKRLAQANARMHETRDPSTDSYETELLL